MDFKGFLNKKNLIIIFAVLFVVSVSAILILTLGGGKPEPDGGGEVPDDSDIVIDLGGAGGDSINRDPYDGPLDVEHVTYEIYEYRLTPDQRREFYNTFDGFSAFSEWYNNGKEAFEAE